SIFSRMASPSFRPTTTLGGITRSEGSSLSAWRWQPHRGSLQAVRPFLSFRDAVQQLGDACEQHAVVLTRVVRQPLVEAVELAQKIANGALIERFGALAVAQVLEVSSVEDLLALAPHGDTEHGHAQADGFTHQREAASRDHRTCGAQVVDEGALRKLAQLDVAEVFLPAHPVEAKLVRQATQLLDQELVGIGGLIDENV